MTEGRLSTTGGSDLRSGLLAVVNGGLAMDVSELDWETAAILLIDIQKLDADPDHGQGLRAKQLGVYEKSFSCYFDQVGAMVPRLVELLAAARACGVEVIHTRIRSQTSNGRDVSPAHRSLGVMAAPKSVESDFLPDVAPERGEIVIDKGSSGAFNGSNIDQILRNLGRRTLVVGGVVTNYCVETTVRDASDRGYDVIVLSDGTAAYSEEEQRFSMRILDGAYATIASTTDLVALLERS